MADEVEPVVPEDIRLFIEGLATISSTFLGLAGSFTGMNEKGVSYGNYFYASGMFEDHVNERRFANLMTLSKKYHGEFNLEHLREAMHAARQFNENHIRAYQIYLYELIIHIWL
jgi:hypothetical protein